MGLHPGCLAHRSSPPSSPTRKPGPTSLPGLAAPSVGGQHTQPTDPLRAATVHRDSSAMAGSQPGLLLLLLLLLLTTHPGSSRAQHWSHGWYPGGKRASGSPQDPQRAPKLPAGRPGQVTHSLPSDALPTPENSVSWKSRTEAQWPLRERQHLKQTLPVSRGRGCLRCPP
ncbi:PREDICTED: progonadoliberin-2 [Condylura cristata]|uniref:progonadoliberin-2 n=1 Tax=Condylura cristata TaxID=143302 RepID=UPI0006435BB9|nr:PREDICTED: progonadoliberin-2 [Condylura cristata]